MSMAPTFSIIEPAGLTAAVKTLKDEGWRLVQIGATRLPEHVELTYSFDRSLEMRNLRLLLLAPGARVPSISGVFWCAFLYENEIHDLFDVQVDDMAVDFHGAFYQTSVPFPFGAAPRLKSIPTRPPAAPAGKTAPAAPAPAAPVAAPAPAPENRAV